jgi:hypothetical protein
VAIWRRIVGLYRAVKDLSDLIPSPYREAWIAAALGLVGGVTAWALAFLDSQPPHVVFLAGLWSLAAVAFFAWVTLWLYWRILLINLIRDAERFIASGMIIRQAMREEDDPTILPGRLRALEDWRTAMHKRMLIDPRVRQFRKELTDADPNRDRITVPIVGLQRALAHLLTYL